MDFALGRTAEERRAHSARTREFDLPFAGAKQPLLEGSIARFAPQRRAICVSAWMMRNLLPCSATKDDSHGLDTEGSRKVVVGRERARHQRCHHPLFLSWTPYARGMTACVGLRRSASIIAITVTARAVGSLA